MAVTIEFNPNQSIADAPKHYVCAAGDTKPTGVPVGSTCWVHDTNIVYKTHDGTTWVLFITLG